MKVFLNSVPVVPPVGLDNLTLQKTRNPRTWGFFYRYIGFVKFGDVIFSDPVAVHTLRDAFARDSLNAEVPFLIQDDQGGTIYKAYVDFASHSFRPGQVSCAFRDDNNTTGLEASFSTLFSLDPLQTISLPGQPLTADSNLILNRSTVSRATSGSVLHALPLQQKDEREQSVVGTLLSVKQPLLFEPIYRNETGKPVTIRLSGVIDASFVTSTNFTASLGYRLLSNNRITSSAPLATFSIASGVTPIVSAINTVITVPNDVSVALGWVSATSDAVFTVTYNPTTGIAVQEPVLLPETTCYGLYAYDLLKELTARCGSSFGFRSDYFLSGPGKSVFITNGANLRGISRPLKVSFTDLFDQLNSIFNLSKTLDGPDRETLRIEQKADQLSEAGITILPTITDVRYKVNTTYLASEVMAGFGNWKGDSLTSAIEPNSTRNYRTSITTFRNPLDLRSSLIAAGSLIEEVRRKQFVAETAGSGKAETHDDDLFIVMVDKFGRATATPFYNADLNPVNCLRNWLNLLTNCEQLTLETHEGGLSDDEPTAFTVTGNPPLIGNLIATVSVPLSMLDYEYLNDWIQFSDGEQTRTGFLTDAVWSQSAEGPTATLTLFC